MMDDGLITSGSSLSLYHVKRGEEEYRAPIITLK